MDKIVNIKIVSFCLIVIISLILYIFNEYFCIGDCYVNIEDRYLGPLFMGSFGLSVSLSFLLFFSEQIFISWLKYVAWWFVLGTAALVLSVNPYTSGILAIDRTDTAIYCASILFVLTLIYAPVMNWRLKTK